LEFQGCVLIVSHDRYFLDRLVDHVFAFEGQGVVKDFPGNYSEYRQWKYDQEYEAEKKEIQQSPQAKAAPVKEEIAAPVVVDTPVAAVEKRKLSFKEQKELETLEKELEQLEKKKTELETLLAGGLSDAEEIRKTSQEFNKVSESIDEKSMRWLELQE
jgi:ATP-binding cassette subfamily F protein uup